MSACFVALSLAVLDNCWPVDVSPFGEHYLSLVGFAVMIVAALRYEDSGPAVIARAQYHFVHTCIRQLSVISWVNAMPLLFMYLGGLIFLVK